MTDEKKPPEEAAVAGAALIGEPSADIAALVAASQKMARGIEKLRVRVEGLESSMTPNMTQWVTEKLLMMWFFRWKPKGI